MIFTGDDYDSFYSSPLADTLIRQLRRSARLLAVGFGFSDPFLIRVVESTLRQLPSDTRHYALIGRHADDPVTPYMRRQFIKKYRLTPVFYQIGQHTSGDGAIREDHSDLLKLLGMLPKPDLGRSLQVVSDGSRTTVMVLPATEVQLPTSPAISTFQAAKREFERDLFMTPAGVPLYIEPHLISRREEHDVTSTEQGAILTPKDLISSQFSYVIAARPEYGGTTLARRLVMDFIGAGTKVLLKDASLLPNYKKRLNEEFVAAGFTKKDLPVLVLDNFDFNRDERLLKETIGTGIFQRIIIIAQINDFNSGNAIPVDQFDLPFKLLSLSNISRSDVRSLTEKFFDTSDQDTVSAIVDKVYSDLIDLCIPITPSNAVMYLTVLYKER
jgi:hypothetical protein